MTPELQIASAVGIGAPNRPEDVTTVQFLLNCVPFVKGGPARELDVTGVFAAETLFALQNFQRANRVDGPIRVDPRGATLARLTAFYPFAGAAFSPGAPSATAVTAFARLHLSEQGAKGRRRKRRR